MAHQQTYREILDTVIYIWTENKFDLLWKSSVGDFLWLIHKWTQVQPKNYSFSARPETHEVTLLMCTTR